jgi:hypothetical protein
MMWALPVIPVFRFATPLMLRSSATSLPAFALGTRLLMTNITEIRKVILFTYLALAFVDALAMANLTHAANNGQETEEKRRKSNPLERIKKENGKKRIC